jgi:hypothetical protein
LRAMGLAIATALICTPYADIPLFYFFTLRLYA